MKKWLTHKNTIISCLLKNGKPLSISDQKSSDNSNGGKFIENSSQNRNQDSNVAYDIASTRNNNINDVIINITEECINIHLPWIQKQLQGVRAQQHSKQLNYQYKEIKASETKNMSITTNVNRAPEIIFIESPKGSKDGNNPKECPKGTVCVVGNSVLNRLDEKLFSRKNIGKVRPF